ncbi:hypothetical protein HWV62_19145 [Athelia sp. TMB]|nr:hypothetical protein HWV62_19145 [Athelia sp. TMB]
MPPSVQMSTKQADWHPLRVDGAVVLCAARSRSGHCELHDNKMDVPFRALGEAAVRMAGHHAFEEKRGLLSTLFVRARGIEISRMYAQMQSETNTGGSLFGGGG